MINYNKSNISLSKSLRKNMTPQEKTLWYQYLSKYKVRFQRQKCIGNYIADFYCAKAKLIIELDGGGHYTDEQIEKDSLRTHNLENMGLKVLRFTNKDIDNDFVNVCNYIDFTVKKNLNKTSL